MSVGLFFDFMKSNIFSVEDSTKCEEYLATLSLEEYERDYCVSALQRRMDLLFGPPFVYTPSPDAHETFVASIPTGLLTPFLSNHERTIRDYFDTPSAWQNRFSVLEYLEEEQEFRAQFVAETRAFLGRQTDEAFSGEDAFWGGDTYSDEDAFPDEKVENVDSDDDGFCCDVDYDGWGYYFSDMQAYRASLSRENRLYGYSY